MTGFATIEHLKDQVETSLTKHGGHLPQYVQHFCLEALDALHTMAQNSRCVLSNCITLDFDGMLLPRFNNSPLNHYEFFLVTHAAHQNSAKIICTWGNGILHSANILWVRPDTMREIFAAHNEECPIED